MVVLGVAACNDKKAPLPSESDKIETPKETTPTERAEQARQAAEMAAAQAVKDAQEAKDRLDKVMKDLEDLDARISQAVGDVAGAQNEADRKAASEKLKTLQGEQAALKARAAEARAAAERAERTKGVHISKECLDNPLAKGCT